MYDKIDKYKLVTLSGKSCLRGKLSCRVLSFVSSLFAQQAQKEKNEELSCWLLLELC